MLSVRGSQPSDESFIPRQESFAEKKAGVGLNSWTRGLDLVYRYAKLATPSSQT
jgi:hypothetical protein